MSATPPPDREGYSGSTDVPLYWCAYGAFAERVLVLHGGPGAHHDYLLPQMLRLGSRRSLVFYDQRGGGRSRGDGSGPVTWSSHVDDLARLIGELRLEPLTLVGYSWGGLLALLYAIESQAGGGGPMPARLVLIDPAPVSRAFRTAFEVEFSRRQDGAVIRALREELAASGLRARDPSAHRQRQFEIGVSAYFADPARARDLTPFRVTGRVQQSVWESLGDFDLRGRLATLRIPALVVHGWHDPIPVQSSFDVARAMQARFVVLEASGHVPYVEQPDALFDAVERFLEDTQPTPG